MDTEKRRRSRIAIALGTTACIIVGFTLLSYFWLSRLSASPRTNLGWQHGEASFILSVPERPQTPSTVIEPQDDVPPEQLDFHFPDVYDTELFNPIPLTDLGVKSCVFPPSVWNVCMIDET
jgi:hypothetical protein